MAFTSEEAASERVRVTLALPFANCVEEALMPREGVTAVFSLGWHDATARAASATPANPFNKLESFIIY
jgi:hypothetical protein